MSLIKRYISRLIKKVSPNLRVRTSEIVAPIIEAGRTNSYVETTSNKADTLHRHIKENSERDLKRAFEEQARNVVRRIGRGRVVLAVDTTSELYYGKNGRLNVRQIKHEKGADEAFYYAVISIVEPKPLPLMAIPYKQGDDLTKIVKELVNYTRTLPLIIEYVLFDRGFYVGDLIGFLIEKRVKYIIFVPENNAMKRYISETDKIKTFRHKIVWKKDFSEWQVETNIVVIKDLMNDGKKDYWCFATSLWQSIHLIYKYKQRWQIETDFRMQDEAKIKTKSNVHIVRYFYFLTSLVLLANWEVNRSIHPEVCFKKYLKQIEEHFRVEIT